jgi:hypothetical protein
VRYATAGPTRKYAIHPDAKRVIVATPDTTATARYDTVTCRLGGKGIELCLSQLCRRDDALAQIVRHNGGEGVGDALRHPPAGASG